MKSFIDDVIKEKRNCIMSYDENVKTDLENFLQDVSVYSWLKRNRDYIKDEHDFYSRIDLSRVIVGHIEKILQENETFSCKFEKIQEYMKKNKEFQLNVMNFDFDVSLCYSEEDVYDKIDHTRKYLDSLSEIINSKSNPKTNLERGGRRNG